MLSAQSGHGPLFSLTNNPGGFPRFGPEKTAGDEGTDEGPEVVDEADGHETDRVMLSVQQAIVDDVYNSPTTVRRQRWKNRGRRACRRWRIVAWPPPTALMVCPRLPVVGVAQTHSLSGSAVSQCSRDLFEGKKFLTADFWPGAVTAVPDPTAAYTIALNASSPAEWTYGYSKIFWSKFGRKPTGIYLSPGGVASVTVPSEMVGAGFKILVGTHAFDLSGKSKSELVWPSRLAACAPPLCRLCAAFVPHLPHLADESTDERPQDVRPVVADR